MASESSASRHFAVRRVNPFSGVLQVAETGNARAYSHNGRVWQIQVLGERPDHTWRSASDTPVAMQFYAFGLWDAAGGLQRVPANPVMDFAAMHDAAERMIETLQQLVDHLPFPLVDDFECWATDASGRPVALLATTEDPARVDAVRVADWQATHPDDGRFTSPSLLRLGIQARDETSGRKHAERLETQVRRRATQRAWYRRGNDGCGVPLDAAAPSLPGSAFPSLGISLDWADAVQYRLVHDFVTWLAPQLLLLQHIGDAERGWLETAATKRAVALADVFALIPSVIDAAGIEAARVEAKLREANR